MLQRCYEMITSVFRALTEEYCHTSSNNLGSADKGTKHPKQRRQNKVDHIFHLRPKKPHPPPSRGHFQSPDDKELFKTVRYFTSTLHRNKTLCNSRILKFHLCKVEKILHDNCSWRSTAHLLFTETPAYFRVVIEPISIKYSLQCFVLIVAWLQNIGSRAINLK